MPDLDPLVPGLRPGEVVVGGLPPAVGAPQRGLGGPRLEAGGRRLLGEDGVEAEVQLEQRVRDLQQVRFELLKRGQSSDI